MYYECEPKMIVLITIATCCVQYIVITVHSNMTSFVDENNNKTLCFNCSLVLLMEKVMKTNINWDTFF